MAAEGEVGSGSSGYGERQREAAGDGFRKGAFRGMRCRAHWSIRQGQGQQLSEMESAAAGELGNLLATAKAVGQDHGILRGVADGGEQDALAGGAGDAVMLRLIAEGTGHAAAAGG